VILLTELASHSRFYRFKFDRAGLPPVTEGNEYHREAMRCVRTAERLRDPGERAKLLELARAYVGLARHVAERHDHGSAPRAGASDPRRLEDG
jgi:hypothetical protein